MQVPGYARRGFRVAAKGTCPTVYRTDRGTLVVQGYAVTAEHVGVDLPDGERLVEIPGGLLVQAVSNVE
jgi:hypothetical protein